MIKVSVLTILLLQFLRMLVEVLGQSNCSEYFQYITEPSRNEIWGQVLIPSPPQNVELHLRVDLSIAARLPKGYIGQIELAQSEEDSVWAIEQGRPLIYYIRFPLQQPIPVITSIRLNNHLYCTSPHAMGYITSIVLEHALHSPQIPLSQMGPDFTTSMTQPSAESTTEFTTRHPTTNLFSPEPDQNNNECGRSLFNIERKISPGDWPWLVAIFHSREVIEYLCVGTLLTNRHVITTANCLVAGQADSYYNGELISHGNGYYLPPTLIFASLGLYRLINWQERGSVNSLIENYTIHPEHQQGKSKSDLAILVLHTPVAYNSNIKSICLWSGPSDLQHVVEKSGYVVAWGKRVLREDYFTIEPQLSFEMIVSQEECLKNNAVFNYHIINRTICADLRSGSPCNGDRGSGLILYNETAGHYELRAVLSSTSLIGTIFDDKTIKYSCNVESYVFYVDVAKYIDWINQQTSMK